VGGFAGAAVASAGFKALVWSGLAKIGAFIVLAPLFGLVIGFTFMVITYWIFRRATPGRVTGLFRKLQLVSAAAYSLGHGGNDAQKTMGIILAVLIATWPADYSVKVGKVAHESGVSTCDYGAPLDKTAKEAVAACRSVKLEASAPTTTGDVVEIAGPGLTITCRKAGDKKTSVAVRAEQNLAARLHKSLAEHVQPEIPFWVVIACHAAMGLGTMSGGWRIVKTMGQKICALQPVHGFAAETSGALCLYGATAFGIPVSTTHTITGAILGVGSTRGLRAVKWGVAGRVIWAWILTIPASALIAAGSWYLFALLGWK
jgi:PiT family inorganic phosphate transporter